MKGQRQKERKRGKEKSAQERNILRKALNIKAKAFMEEPWPNQKTRKS